MWHILVRWNTPDDKHRNQVSLNRLNLLLQLQSAQKRSYLLGVCIEDVHYQDVFLMSDI